MHVSLCSNKMFIFMLVYDTVLYISPNFQLIPINTKKFLVSFKLGIFPKFPRRSSHGKFPEIFRLFATLVLLHNPSALELEVTNWWLDILLQDFLIECRIHGSINYGKSSRSWSCKAAPDHHTTTTMFDCWYDVLFMKCCVGFTPDVTGHTPSKKFNFCLISPQNICPKVLGIIKIFFWQMWDALFCSFWSAVAFALELSHGCRFCPVSFPVFFLLLNHEHWP